jgi:FSR family fosmidomycin resistance protein-like MFS transporter
LNIFLIFILTLVHFTGDFYSSFFIPLLPEFVDKLSLTLAEVGLLTGATRILAFIVQPAVGYLLTGMNQEPLFCQVFFLPFSLFPFPELHQISGPS